MNVSKCAECFEKWVIPYFPPVFFFKLKVIKSRRSWSSHTLPVLRHLYVAVMSSVLFVPISWYFWSDFFFLVFVLFFQGRNMLHYILLLFSVNIIMHIVFCPRCEVLPQWIITGYVRTTDIVFIIMSVCKHTNTLVLG